jgi:signal transduction histidine kinase
VLSGYLELVSNNTRDEKVRRYLEKATLAVQSIGEQMEFIREYQKLGISEPEWFEMKQLLSRTISKTELGNIEIEYDLEGLSIYTDPMIEKVFTNLMENSVKHGMTVRKIQITYLRGSDWLEIFYKDDGKGIAPEMKQRMFDRNYLHRLGHGMNFIQEVLRITGLEIDEIGKPDQGVTFRIKVPNGCYRLVEGLGKSYMNDTPLSIPERAEK